MLSIGLDVHRRHCQVCELGDEGEIREYRIETRREEFLKHFGGREPARLLLEASTESEWVARCLESLGHEVIVADPNFAPMYASRTRRVKTDKRDARALAMACRLQAYRASHRLSDESRALRSRILVRESFVQSRTRLINLVRALLRQQGWRVPSGSTPTFGARVRGLELDALLEETISPLVEEIESLTERIRRATDWLQALSRTDPVLGRLCTVPGVGPVTAAAFVTTLDDPARFASARGVRSFLGLIPRESSSGEKQRRGPITKIGNRRIRSLLVEAAWCIWRTCGRSALPLREWAARIALRRGLRRAIVALARKLAGILWAIWRDRSVYRSEEVCRQAA